MVVKNDFIGRVDDKGKNLRVQADGFVRRSLQ